MSILPEPAPNFNQQFPFINIYLDKVKDWEYKKTMSNEARVSVDGLMKDVSSRRKKAGEEEIKEKELRRETMGAFQRVNEISWEFGVDSNGEGEWTRETPVVEIADGDGEMIRFFIKRTRKTFVRPSSPRGFYVHGIRIMFDDRKNKESGLGAFTEAYYFDTELQATYLGEPMKEIGQLANAIGLIRDIREGLMQQQLQDRSIPPVLR